jgi:hypothetical protein
MGSELVYISLSHFKGERSTYMNGASQTYPTQPATGEKSWSLKTMAGGSIAEALGGVAAVVLAILALVGIAPTLLAAIATIVLGAAFFCEGGTIAAGYRRVLSGFENRIDMSGGMTVEFLAGLTGIVLGILAFFTNFTGALLGSAVIVFGAAMLLSSRTISRLAWSSARPADGQSSWQQVAGEAASASAGSQVMIGLGAIVLGILALAGLTSAVLINVALLSLGFGVMMVGTLFGSSLSGS